ncbi:hypothetical protein ACPV5T_02000 [Vibrio astriarenae]
MRMIYKPALAIMLAGGLSLPATASTSNQWTYGGTIYSVSLEQQTTTVSVSRDVEMANSQIKALCRRGLGLQLRANYENILIDKKWISEPLSDWPMASLNYELSDIKYIQASKTDAKCSATVVDTDPERNLDSSALNYALAYYATRQYDLIKPLLPHLMQKPAVAIDAAALVTLLLVRDDQSKAKQYFQRYVDITSIKSEKIKYWLSEWQYQQGNIQQSYAIIQSCTSSDCARFSSLLEDELMVIEQDSADDLSSYFN